MAWIDRLSRGLKRTRSELTDSVTAVFKRNGRLGEAELEEVEEILIRGDIGARVAADLIGEVRERAGRGVASCEEFLRVLGEGIAGRLAGCERRLAPREDGEPTVILVSGVNGSGKTTTIAKLAMMWRREEPSLPITLAAADTFRAAAIEQLGVWAERVGADLIRHRIGADPSAVVFDAIEHARHQRGVVMIDTAGRMQTNHNLMEELRKIERTVGKKLDRPSDERILVVDATTGQNGISQAQRFHEAIDVTGIVLTKLDGTGRGGVVLAIWEALRIPLMYIGVGEGHDDLHAFHAAEFVDALLATS